MRALQERERAQHEEQKAFYLNLHALLWLMQSRKKQAAYKLIYTQAAARVKHDKIK